MWILEQTVLALHGLGWPAVALVLVTAVVPLIALAITLKGVSSAEREGVLRGLAECFRSWPGIGRRYLERGPKDPPERS